jgi:transcriptional regulator with XRE-family HTH domain
MLPKRQRSLPHFFMTIVRDPVQLQLISFGAKLRELRLQRGWSLDELARQSNLSKAFLSRLESGDRQASIAAVLTLARIFDVSLASLFESQLARAPYIIVRVADHVPQDANGLTYVPLSNAERFSNLQPLRLTISPKREGTEHFKHDGEEWIYLLSGKLTLSIAGETHDLEEGDAAHFDSRLPHRLIARGPRAAEVLLVATPFSLSDGAMRSSSGEHRAFPVTSSGAGRRRIRMRPAQSELLS